MPLLVYTLRCNGSLVSVRVKQYARQYIAYPSCLSVQSSDPMRGENDPRWTYRALCELDGDRHGHVVACTVGTRIKFDAPHDGCWGSLRWKQERRARFGNVGCRRMSSTSFLDRQPLDALVLASCPGVYGTYCPFLRAATQAWSHLLSVHQRHSRVRVCFD